LYAHLYLDRVTRKKLYDDAIEVCMWIERCNRPIPEAMGDWFGGDYPDTLKDVLTLIGQDAVPMLAALDGVFDAWAAENATEGMEVERGVGEYVSELRGVRVTAGVRSYVSWKIQRLRDAFDAISPAEQRGVRETLAASGCDQLLSKDKVTCRLEKRGFKLVVA
jgi:hypothetical protein